MCEFGWDHNRRMGPNSGGLLMPSIEIAMNQIAYALKGDIGRWI